MTSYYFRHNLGEWYVMVGTKQVFVRQLLPNPKLLPTDWRPEGGLDNCVHSLPTLTNVKQV